MALRRLLLLCVIAFRVWDTETKPIRFVCNRAARKGLNIVPEMETALSVCLSVCLHGFWHQPLVFQNDCIGLMTLSTPAQLPCTELHLATWENKSEQEKRGDIVASLNLLIAGVKTVRILTEGDCEMLLQSLENNINNYLLILTNLQLSGPVLPPSLSCVPQSSLNLSTVLQSYNQLISGKLERFIVNLEYRCT
ncbi:thrombopoietin isoform X2 [Cololabis saira]|uniref:thrombopoietin isoform X2 n=1 Tax=Cololabis saira TaxID=129043 RepID=UPI002AD27F04|nr:thrombopoietin isoform X2 [Cololabis saira]